jgi:hypothetical protein
MSSSDRISAVLIHESAYRLAGERFGIKLEPTRLDRGLRRCIADVIDLDANDDDDTREAAEQQALLLLCGHAAVSLLAPGYERHTNDQVEAGGVLCLDLFARGGSLKNPSQYREHHLTVDRLKKEAEVFVTENLDRITRMAASLQRAKPHRTRRPSSQSQSAP